MISVTNMPLRLTAQRLLLLLCLWLVPQVLLAAHMHVANDTSSAECDVCAQLSGTTAAIASTPSASLQTFVAPGFAAAEQAFVDRDVPAAACRGPPNFLPHIF